MRTLYRLIYIPSLLGLLYTVFVFVSTPFHVIVPGKLKTYESKDKTISILHPDNWAAREVGGNGTGTTVAFLVNAEPTFEVTTDLQGSLFADIDKSGGGTPVGSDLGGLPGGMGLSGGGKKSTLQKLHDAQAREMAGRSRFDGFEDGDTHKIQLAGVDALMTDIKFQSVSLMGKRDMVGERITALTNDRALYVIYSCPKAQEVDTQKVFHKMLASLQVTSGG